MRTSVALLRGGTSGEYGLSLKTGAAIMAALPEDEFDVRDILIDKKGTWHLRGVPVDPMRSLSQIDVAFNAIHGGIGEDGTIQRILDQAGIPYTGSDASSSARTLNKILTHMALKDEGLPMPTAIAFSLSDEMTTLEIARQVFELMGPPYVVKPPSDGASLGIAISKTFNDLPNAIGDALDVYGTVLVEEYIIGHQVSVGILNDFRNEEVYALPPAHIVTHEPSLMIYHDHHHSGTWDIRVPSQFTHDEKDELMHIAKTAHSALGLSHFSRADMILSNHGPYLLEVNSIPGLYEHAVFPKMLESVGSSVEQFARHALELARRD